MKTEIDDGGPAFPMHMPYLDDLTGQGRQEGMTAEMWSKSPGMSLRDWFAAKATDGDVDYVLRAFQEFGFRSGPSRAAARYAHADIMIQARKRIP